MSIFAFIMRCDIGIRKEMYSNIVLAGGTTMMPGFSARLHRGITQLAPPALKVNVIAPPICKTSARIGGAVFANRGLRFMNTTKTTPLSFTASVTRCLLIHSCPAVELQV